MLNEKKIFISLLIKICLFEYVYFMGKKMPRKADFAF